MSCRSIAKERDMTMEHDEGATVGNDRCTRCQTYSTLLLDGQCPTCTTVECRALRLQRAAVDADRDRLNAEIGETLDRLQEVRAALAAETKAREEAEAGAAAMREALTAVRARYGNMRDPDHGHGYALMTTRCCLEDFKEGEDERHETDCWRPLVDCALASPAGRALLDSIKAKDEEIARLTNLLPPFAADWRQRYYQKEEDWIAESALHAATRAKLDEVTRERDRWHEQTLLCSDKASAETAERMRVTARAERAESDLAKEREQHERLRRANLGGSLRAARERVGELETDLADCAGEGGAPAPATASEDKCEHGIVSSFPCARCKPATAAPPETATVSPPPASALEVAREALEKAQELINQLRPNTNVNCWFVLGDINNALAALARLADAKGEG